jgi:hypothetical protein
MIENAIASGIRASATTVPARSSRVTFFPAGAGYWQGNKPPDLIWETSAAA